MPLRIVLLALAAVLPLEALAQDTEVLDDVVVTASRVEERAGEAAVRVEVIDRASIERSGARDAAELLEEFPGVYVDHGFRGDSISIRGLDPEYVLVLVDGDRVPGRVGGGIDLGRYSAESIERIELVRGASSALYGSDAIAGVVHIITRRGTGDGDHVAGSATASAGGATAALVDITAEADGSVGPIGFRVSGGFHWAEPFRFAPDANEIALSVGDRATAGSERLQYELGGRLDWRPDSHFTLALRVEWVSRELSGVDRSSAGAVFDRTQLGDQLQVGLTTDWRHGGTHLGTRISYSLFREQYLLDQRGSAALDDDQDNSENLGTLAVQLDQTIGDHRITVGLEELYQDLDSARLVAFGHRFRASPFLQDEWQVVDDDVSLVLVPGVRVDLDSQFGAQVSPRLAVRFDPWPQLVLRASYGWGFRAPSFQELLLRFENPSVGYVVQGNPSLGAETARGLDVGAEWTPIDELRLSASFFRNDVDGMIAVVTVEDSATGTLFSYANLTTAYTQGLESSIRGRVMPELVLQASYTFTDTWDGEHGRPLEGRAAHRITAAATLDIGGDWDLGATARGAVTGERPFYADADGDGVDETTFAPWFGQVDLRVWKGLFDHLELFVGVDNLLDAGGAYLNVRPRTFYGGIRGRL